MALVVVLSFQSLIGRLKTPSLVITVKFIPGFQSLIGRLKTLEAIDPDIKSTRGFNPL